MIQFMTPIDYWRAGMAVWSRSAELQIEMTRMAYGMAGTWSEAMMGPSLTAMRMMTPTGSKPPRGAATGHSTLAPAPKATTAKVTPLTPAVRRKAAEPAVPVSDANGAAAPIEAKPAKDAAEKPVRKRAAKRAAAKPTPAASPAEKPEPAAKPAAGRGKAKAAKKTETAAKPVEEVALAAPSSPAPVDTPPATVAAPAPAEAAVKNPAPRRRKPSAPEAMPDMPAATPTKAAE